HRGRKAGRARADHPDFQGSWGRAAYWHSCSFDQQRRGQMDDQRRREREVWTRYRQSHYRQRDVEELAAGALPEAGTLPRWLTGYRLLDVKMSREPSGTSI